MTLPKPRSPKPTPTAPQSADVASALRTLQVEASGITALAAALEGDLGRAFDAAVGMMRAARGRVIVTGLGKSGHIARKIASTLASTGTPAFFVHAAEANHGDLGMITSDDVILALSWSGETVELKNMINYSRRFRIGFITVTADADSTLARAADVVLTLPKAREACPNNLAPTTSSTLQLALGDALAVALLEGRGFTSIDFGVLHPGGKLGAMLKSVRDIMHSDDSVPIRPLGTLMGEAMEEMSRKRFGCVAIVDPAGDIVGVITDGDLRRKWRPDLMSVTVDEIMTTKPKTIPLAMLASEALDILNTSEITALFVTDGRKPVGIVHVHDMLRVGAA